MSESGAWTLPTMVPYRMEQPVPVRSVREIEVGRWVTPRLGPMYRIWFETPSFPFPCEVVSLETNSIARYAAPWLNRCVTLGDSIDGGLDRSSEYRFCVDVGWGAQRRGDVPKMALFRNAGLPWPTRFRYRSWKCKLTGRERCWPPEAEIQEYRRP